MLIILMCFSLLIGPIIGIELMKSGEPGYIVIGLITFLSGCLFCAFLFV